MSEYKKQSIIGFTVLIHPDVLVHGDDTKQLLIELKSQLEGINEVVPQPQLSSLKNMKIWVEWLANDKGIAEFHESRQWLRNNGYNLEKEFGIEIKNTRNFVKWSRLEQPWVIMHELAHGYHNRVLGNDYAVIEAAYRHALMTKLYQAVPHINISRGKINAYAIKNSREYFAELTEAYFGKNDFFPFNRQELAAYDVIGFRMMQGVWRGQ